MNDKTILITGCSSGIGKAASFEFAKMGFKLIFIARNKSKIVNQINEIKLQTSNNNLDYFICDLSSQKDIYNVSEAIKRKYSNLDILINNAGLIVNDRKLTIDNYEYTFALDHLGYFLLTGLLLDLLRRVDKARIINVSSTAHNAGIINFDDLMAEKEYSSIRSYCQAKLANIMFTYELAKKLIGTNITVNCMHPGVIKTNFGSDLRGFYGVLIKIGHPFLGSPKKGAKTMIYLATSTEVENISGKYFYKNKPKATSKESYNTNVSENLWRISEELTNFRFKV